MDPGFRRKSAPVAVSSRAGRPPGRWSARNNDVVYAELSIGYARMEQLDAMISSAGLVCAAMPRPALFLAGKAFQRYHSAGGRKIGVLPDSFIGAHAVIADALLITRDAACYRSYFPGIMLIAPK